MRGGDPAGADRRRGARHPALLAPHRLHVRRRRRGAALAVPPCHPRARRARSARRTMSGAGVGDARRVATREGREATTAAELFAGPGEVRALARTLDWGATPLGWP